MESPKKPKYVKNIRMKKVESPLHSDSSNDYDGLMAEDYFANLPTYTDITTADDLEKLNGKIPCDICGKHFKPNGIKNHKRALKNGDEVKIEPVL